jgi:hypothetical protein
MWRTSRGAAACGLAGLILLQAPRALAWGPLTRSLVADRVYSIVVPQAPWLAPNREAFLWGANAQGLGELKPCSPEIQAKCLAPKTVGSLWKGAQGNPSASAFALGWAVTDTLERKDAAHWFSKGDRQALYNALSPKPAPPYPGSAAFTPLVEYAVDAALVPVADDTLASLFRGTVISAGTPTGLPFRELACQTLDADDSLFLDWARVLVDMSAEGPEHYLEADARFQGVSAWQESLRSPGARLALGDLTRLITQSVEACVKRASTLLKS